MRWIFARLLWPALTYGLIFCCGCHKTLVATHEGQIEIHEDQQLAEDDTHAQQKIESVNETKKTGPVEKHEHEEDDFGWAPPPPGAPKDAKPEWKPLRHVRDIDTKSGASVTKKDVDTAAAAQDGKKIDVDRHLMAKGAEKDVIKEKWYIGLSLAMKLMIAAVAVVILLGVVAYLNPNALGWPVRALKWVIARLAALWGQKP